VADRRTQAAKEFDAELRVRLTSFLVDYHGESNGSLLDLEEATRLTVTDFRKDRLLRKGGHGKPVNTPGNGSDGGSGGGGGPDPVVVVSVNVTPTTFALVTGQSAQLVATPHDALGGAITGKTVTWQSTNPSVATVDSSGLVTAVSVGSTTIRATVDGIDGTSSGTVSLVPVASVSVSPSSFSVQATTVQQLTATTRDGSNNILAGRVVTWQSNNTAVATVSATGLVTGVVAGSATITATSEGIQGASTATVTAAPSPAIASVTVTPSPFSVQVGATQALTAAARDAGGNTVATSFAWSSNNSAVASVNASGVVTGVTTGVATISATAAGITGTSTANVVAVPVATVTVSPGTFSKTVGQTQQLVATLKDANNNTLTGRVVTWSSSNNALATVSSSGLVTVLAPGTVVITATCETKTGTSTGTLSAAPPAAVATVSVSPSSFTKSVGSTQLLTATVKDASNNVLTGRTITWASSSPSVATVTTPGQTATVTAVAAGSATITATCETVPGTSTATVTLVPVATVSVSPSTFSVVVGATQQLTVTLRDSSGNILTGRTITYASSDTTKATVSVGGLVTAVAAGSFIVTATSEGKQGTSAGSVPSASITPSPIDSPSTTVYVPRTATWTLPSTFLDSRYDRGGVPLTWTRDVLLTDSGNAATNTTTLQTEINNAATRAGHTRLRLPNAWVCNKIRLKAHTQGVFWTYIEAETKPSVEGVRANTAAMASAPQIRSTTASETGAVFCDLGADYTRFVGIRFLATTGSPCYRLLYLSGTPDDVTEDADTEAADLPQWIVVDRCWVDGANTSRVVNGIVAHTREFACVDSVLDGIYYVGTENHAINGYNALGPWKIVGNKIEAAAIGLLVGGADPRVSGLQTSDIEIRRNFFTKRASWNLRNDATFDDVPSKVVKNLLELKFGNRVLVEGNVFDGSPYGDDQKGSFLVWKVENSGSTNPGAKTENVTYRFNRARNVAGGYEFIGVGVGGPVTTPLRRVEHTHNLVETLAGDSWVGSGNHSRGMFFADGATDIIVDHDTLCVSQSETTAGFTQPMLFSGTADVGLAVRNCLLLLPISSPPNDADSRSIFGDGSQVVSPDTATNTLAQYAPGYQFLDNVLVKLAGSATSGYPTQSEYTASVAAVGCVSPSTGDFRLLGSSPYKGMCVDGSDPGCDMTLVSTATAGVATAETPTCNIVTNSNIIPTSAFPKPAYLTPAIEPNFGTTIIRVSGDPGAAIPTAGSVWPTVAGHQYAKVQPWSADQAYIFLNRDNTSDYGGGFAGLLIDGTTYAPIVRRNHPGNEARWDPATADQMICVMSNGSVSWWNPITDVTTTKYSTTAYSSAFMGNYEGNPSADGRYVAVVATRTSDSKQVVYVVDIQSGTKSSDLDVTAEGFTDLDWASVSQGGGYVVLHGVTSLGNQRSKIYDRATLALVSYWTDHPLGHFDLGIDGSGNEVAFGAASSGTYAKRFIVRRLDTAAITPVSPAVSFNWHASCRNTDRQGWGYVVTNDATGSYLDNTIYAVKMDGTQIERLCRYRGTITSTFESQPHACPSPDGKRVFFRSNWSASGGTPIHGFVCDVRGICP
jgi:uncharacterized protein YjdB